MERQLLDRRPVGQQPCLEIMLCRVRMELPIGPNPLTHLGPGICGVDEVVGSRVDVRQGYDVIRAALQ